MSLGTLPFWVSAVCFLGDWVAVINLLGARQYHVLSGAGSVLPNFCFGKALLGVMWHTKQGCTSLKTATDSR